MNASEHAAHTPSADEPQQPKPGRDARGRFAKGNLGGPGNPFARKVAALRSALIATVTEEDMRFIAEQLIVTARLGDLAAIKLLFQYVLGKPAAAVDPDTLDLQELELYRRGPTAREVHEAACERLPADAVVEVLRVEKPCLGAGFQEAVARGVLGGEEDQGDEGDQGDQEREQAPSPNGGVADDPRQSMTTPGTNESGERVAEALALLKELRRRAEAAGRDEDRGAPPSGNGGDGVRGGGQRALDWLQRARDG
jgi:hypothetical protein